MNSVQTIIQSESAQVRSESAGRVGSAVAGLTIEVTSDRTHASSVWQSLEQSLSLTGLANSWCWTACWLDAYGDSVPHSFVIANRGDSPVGIALLTRGRAQKRGPLPVRSAHIGTSGEEPARGVWVEYNRLLVAEPDREAFLNRLLTAPGISQFAIDLVALDGFDPDEIPASIRERLIVREQVCHVAKLNLKPTVLESFDSDTRRKMRKNSARFADAFGPIQTEWVADPERGLAVLDELIVHHQARWQAVGEPGSFADDRFVRFHRLFVERGMPEGRIVLARVTAGDTLIGIFYGFIEGDVIYHYQWGLPAFDDNSLSPGFVTGYQVMEEAKTRGFSEVNWLAGDTRYKRDLSNAQRSLVWAEYGRSPWHWCLTQLTALYGRLPESGKRKVRSRQ